MTIFATTQADGQLIMAEPERNTIPVARMWGPGLDAGPVTFCGLGGAKCAKGPHGAANPYCVVPHGALIAARESDARTRALTDEAMARFAALQRRGVLYRAGKVAAALAVDAEVAATDARIAALVEGVG